MPKTVNSGEILTFPKKYNFQTVYVESSWPMMIFVLVIVIYLYSNQYASHTLYLNQQKKQKGPETFISFVTKCITSSLGDPHNALSLNLPFAYQKQDMPFGK